MELAENLHLVVVVVVATTVVLDLIETKINNPYIPVFHSSTKSWKPYLENVTVGDGVDLVLDVVVDVDLDTADRVTAIVKESASPTLAVCNTGQ